MPTSTMSVQSQIPFPCRKTRSATKSKVSSEVLREGPTSHSARKHRKDKSRKRIVENSGDKENSLPSPQKPTRSATPLKERQCSPPKRSRENVDKATSLEYSRGRCRLFQEDENETKSLTEDKSKSNNGSFCIGKSPSKAIQADSAKEHIAKTPKARCSLFAEQPNLTPYRKVAQCLHTSLPDSILCREDHSKKIKSFVDSHLKKKNGGGLYISGAPGTGKTTCVMKVLGELEECYSGKFQTVFVNCMSIKHSNGIYGKMLNELSNKKYDGLTMKEAEKKFMVETKKDKTIILVLDEVDQLDTKEHNILYQIFELPSLPKSRLILIGIANSLDLTDRILPRLQSMPSSKPEVLQFSPYSKDEILKILTDRLDQDPHSESVIDSKAVQLCARKVASVAGDARKALDILRRSIEKVEAEARKQLILTTPKSNETPIRKVSLSHVLSVVSDVYGSKFSGSGPAMSFPLQQKVLICTLLLLTQDDGCKEISAKKLSEGYAKVCKRKQIVHVGQEDFFNLCTLLESRGVINLKKNKNPLASKISLRLQYSEVSHALQDQTLLSSIMGINRSDL